MSGTLKQTIQRRIVVKKKKEKSALVSKNTTERSRVLARSRMLAKR